MMEYIVIAVSSLALIFSVIAVCLLLRGGTERRLLDAMARGELAQEQKLEQIRQTTERRLAAMQEGSSKQLDLMRGVVEEKLQKTLETRITQSFSLVSERLEQVYKSLGEMQALAVGVGDLKKVLSGVKTRGILGEIQLGAILTEILSPEQYECNVATVPGSRASVEFAIKMPGGGGEPVWLPVDSKFPLDRYSTLCDAYDAGDAAAVEAAASVLRNSLKLSAKEIRDKYIQPPHTTEFAVLFLPFEGLYAEAVRHGMVEELQRDYRVSIAGPTTMGALLNSFQMGFRTLAIQKRSGEVWALLGQVKSEFIKFADALDKTKRHLDMAGSDLDNLVGVRTRSILRSLKEVETDGDPDMLA
jgi:DNA recombination protein RmuC